VTEPQDDFVPLTRERGEENSKSKIKKLDSSKTPRLSDQPTRPFSKSQQAHTSMLKRAIMAFTSGYKERMHGVKAVIGGKEIKLIGVDLVRFEGMGDGWEEVYFGCIETFFSDRVKDVRAFAEKAGYSYPVFHSQIDKLLLAADRAAKETR